MEGKTRAAEASIVILIAGATLTVAYGVTLHGNNANPHPWYVAGTLCFAGAVLVALLFFGLHPFMQWAEGKWRTGRGFGEPQGNPAEPPPDLTVREASTGERQQGLTHSKPAEPPPDLTVREASTGERQQGLTHSKGRNYIRKKPADITAAFRDHTDVQAHSLVQPFLGQWLRVSGKFKNLTRSAGSAYGVTIVQDINDYPSPAVFLDDPTVLFDFAERWESQLLTLSMGDEIEIVGRIRDVMRGGIFLEDCELL